MNFNQNPWYMMDSKLWTDVRKEYEVMGPTSTNYPAVAVRPRNYRHADGSRIINCVYRVRRLRSAP